MLGYSMLIWLVAHGHKNQTVSRHEHLNKKNLIGEAHLNMNQEEANKLIHVTATILCLDVPIGTEFGIDNHSYIVGDRFKGVKLIPPGVHFVYYR